MQLLARAATMRGWALAPAGEIEEGIAQIRAGVEATRALGPIFLPYFLGSLAEGYVKAGRVDLALDSAAITRSRVVIVADPPYSALLRTAQLELASGTGLFRHTRWTTGLSDPSRGVRMARTLP